MNTPSMPDKIQCTSCRKIKGITSFSRSQVRNIQAVGPGRGRGRGSGGGGATCLACTTQPITERQCAACSKYKALDGFSKTQRRNGDRAVSLRELRYLCYLRHGALTDLNVVARSRDASTVWTSNLERTCRLKSLLTKTMYLKMR